MGKEVGILRSKCSAWILILSTCEKLILKDFFYVLWHLRKFEYGIDNRWCEIANCTRKSCYSLVGNFALSLNVNAGSLGINQVTSRDFRKLHRESKCVKILSDYWNILCTGQMSIVLVLVFHHCDKISEQITLRGEYLFWPSTSSWSSGSMSPTIVKNSMAWQKYS